MRVYEELVNEALTVPVEGWDFGWLEGRATGGDPPWSYPDLARELLPGRAAVLDLDTGGGELLAGLAPLPAGTVATEGWAPNVPVARRRLAPLGVAVVEATDPDRLPVGDGGADLVLNRHGRLLPGELARVLRPGGALLTQQVGSDDCAELNDALGAPPAYPPGSWTADVAVAALAGAGLRAVDVREARPAFAFADVGAVAFQLRLVAWQVRDFTVERYGDALRRLDARIRERGPFVAHAHRFLITAVRD